MNNIAVFFKKTWILKILVLMSFVTLSPQVNFSQCNGISISNPQSMIQNSSLDGNSCCPSSITLSGDQMDCIDYFFQASEATSDYHVVGCGNSLNNIYVPNVPSGSQTGNGIIGIVNSGNNKEYIGAVLSQPLIPGESYTLNFKLGFGTTKPPSAPYYEYSYSSHSPVNFALFVSNGALPFAGTGCPSSWTLVEEVTVTGNNQWVNVSITDFQVSSSVNKVVIGPACGSAPLNGYYFVDDIILNQSNVLSPQIDLVESGHPCTGITLTGIPTISNTGYTFQWFFNNNPIAGATSSSYQIPVGSNGEYFVRMYLNGQCLESSIYSYLTPLFQTDLDEELCFGESIEIGNEIFDQTGTYEILLATSAGCDSIINLNLNIRNELVITHEQVDEILCAGEKTQVNIYSNANDPFYTWNDGNSDSIRNLPAGNYNVFVIDDYGCMSSPYSFFINEPDSLKLFLEIQHETCVGYNDGEVLPFIEGGLQPYFIKFNDKDEFIPFVDSMSYSFLAPGDYLITVKDSNECFIEKNFTILPREPIDVFINPLGKVAIGDSATLSLLTIPEIEITTYQWDGNQLGCDTCSQPTIYPETPPFNKYLVKIIEKEVGCIYYANLDVEIIDGVYIPNVFSPNSDGINDFFFIQSNPASVLNVEEFYIFDRWGEHIFSQKSFLPNDPIYGWDGTFRGKDMPAGVYVFFAKILLANNEVILKKGSITLLR